MVRLRYAYADTLLAAGRTDDALEWFHRTVAIDSDEITDAAERVDAAGEPARQPGVIPAALSGPPGRMPSTARVAQASRPQASRAAARRWGASAMPGARRWSR